MSSPAMATPPASPFNGNGIGIGIGTPPLLVAAQRASRNITPDSITSATARGGDRAVSGGQSEGPRIIIGIDYGTTFTGVAWVTTNGRDRPDLEAIQSITSWRLVEAPKVPSQISYSNTENGNSQWGYDIDANSRVIKWTKLELEESKTRLEELERLSQTLHSLALLDMSPEAILDGGIPLDIGKEAEEIVADYLAKIADKTHEAMLGSGSFTGNSFNRTAVDIIITHPADWSGSALNKTYRAAMSAFSLDLFPKRRNVSFVSEPEACAHFTIRAAQKRDRGRLRRGDCFIAVDAGGGTVDLASYKVTDVGADDSGLRLEQVGDPSGNQFGATLIDRNFFQLLEERMGSDDYNKLTEHRPDDFGAGGHFMIKENSKQVMDRFETIKHNFDGKHSELDHVIQLPGDLALMDDEGMGIVGGTIRLSTEDLLRLFAESVDGTLMLIEAQLTQVRLKGLKVKSIFLSGGLGSNPYLGERVQQFARKRGITVERGELLPGANGGGGGGRVAGLSLGLGRDDEPPRYEAMNSGTPAALDGWSAVARGAVLKGLGLFSAKPAVVGSCPRHYGIKTRRHFTYYDHRPTEAEVDIEGVQWATDQLRWFVRKGDVILPGKAIEERYECHMSMKATEFASAAKAAGKTPGGGVFRDILFVASSADEAPSRYQEKSNSTEQVVPLRCDVSKVPEPMRRTITHKKAGKYIKFFMTVHISVARQVELKVMSGNVTLDEQVIDL